MAELETRSFEQLPTTTSLEPTDIITMQSPGGPAKKIEVRRAFQLFQSCDIAVETVADLTTDAGAIALPVQSLAVVYANPDSTQSGYWVKTSAAGSGTWALTDIQYGIAGAFAQQAAEAAAAAAAFGNFKPGTLAEAEAATEVGERFSIVEDGILVALLRTEGGSTEIARAITRAALEAPTADTLIGTDDGADGELWTNIRGFINYLRSTAGSSIVRYSAPGPDGMPRTIEDKLAEISVSIADYGAIPNVNTTAAANANKAALEKAFAQSLNVDVPGDQTVFYAFPAGCTVPDNHALRGKGAWVRCRGEGFSLGNFAQFLDLRLEGLNPAVAVGTKGSGVAPRTSPTPDSPQYALLTANTKVGCVVRIPHIRNGLINGLQMNNGSFHEVEIGTAENFGNDGVFSPTEGAIIYAPAVTDCRFTVRDGAQTYGLGAVMGGAWSRMRFDLVIHDTRRAALHSAVGSVTGPGNEVRIKAYRLGGIASVASTGPNHNQTGCGIFWPGAAKAEYIKVIDPVIIDFAENAFEGPMEIINPTVGISEAAGVFWDAAYAPPNPGVFYGNQKIYGGTVNNGRGWIMHTGGEEGAGVFDVCYAGTGINNPRPAVINGVLTAPKYVHIQPVGAGNVADNVTVKDIIGYDSSGHVAVGFYVQGTGGASFSSRCQVTGNRSTTGNNQIAANVHQFGNNWNPLNSRSAPHYQGVDCEEAGGGFKRAFWGYGIDYSPSLASWKLDDFGTERTLFVHGNNQVQVFVIPRTVPAGALSDASLNNYLVGTFNQHGFVLRNVTTATRPTAEQGASPGLVLFDTTIDGIICRNAANSGWVT